MLNFFYDFPVSLVGLIMGSKNDWETMKECAAVLKELKIPFEAEVVSAHRTPDKMFAYAEKAEKRGLKIIIVAAGGSAHLPGMIAAKTSLPVLGVPVESKALKGLDSLLSINQMPYGIPVMTLAIGVAGAKNAALAAAAILALEASGIRKRLKEFRQKQTMEVIKNAKLA